MTPQDSALGCTSKAQHAHPGSPQARVILVGIGYVLLVAHTHTRIYVHKSKVRFWGVLYLTITIFHRSGASCSGKTTLAKHLHNILPGSFIIHQDVTVVPIFYLYLLQTQNSG